MGLVTGCGRVEGQQQKKGRGTTRNDSHSGRALPLLADRCLHYLGTWTPGHPDLAVRQPVQPVGPRYLGRLYPAVGMDCNALDRPACLGQVHRVVLTPHVHLRHDWLFARA